MCAEEFCQNGGTCLYLDTNCTCPEDWTGDRCNESLLVSTEAEDMTMTIIIASSTAGACVLMITTVTILVVYVAVYYYRRRRRVKFIQANIRCVCVCVLM